MDLEKNIGAGAGGLAPGDPGGVALAAAQQVVATYPGAANCPGPGQLKSGPFHDAVAAFKTAFNIWSNGDPPGDTGSPLAHNSSYDQACADAINSIPGAPAAPAPCTGAAPPPPAKTCPAGTHDDGTGNCVADAVTTTGGLPSWARWLLIALVTLGAIGAGIWLYRYYGKKNAGAMEGKRKPRRRGKRKKR